MVAFTFGLLHGLGFANALSEVGLPQSAIPVALLFFNVGVEIGQLLFYWFCLGSHRNCKAGEASRRHCPAGPGRDGRGVFRLTPLEALLRFG